MALTMTDINTFVSKYMIPSIPTGEYDITWTGFFQRANTTDISGTFLVRPHDNPNLIVAIRRVVLYGADDVLGAGPLHAFSVIETKIAAAVLYIAWALRSRVVAWRILDLVERPVEDKYEGLPFSIKRMSPYMPDGMRNWDMAAIAAVDQIIKGGVSDAS